LTEKEIGEDKSKNIETTKEELDAFLIIKAILRQKIEINRIFYRDAQSYFAILLDDNNRKSICRIYLGKRKYIGIFDDNKREIKTEIQSIDNIFEYGEQLIKTAESYKKNE
jgi:hypothetical protein